MATLATLSCTNAPVQQAASHKDDYQQAYVYGFPMIAAYQALRQFNVDKTNSQYKGPFNLGFERCPGIYAQGHGDRDAEQ